MKARFSMRSLGKIVATSFLAVGLGSAVATAQSSVTIALPAPSVLFAPAYIAAERGFFRDNGIDPKIIYVAGPGVVTAVLGRSADFTLISGGIQVAAAVRNQKLVAIANTQDRFTTDIVISKKVADRLGPIPATDALARIKALKGLTIGIDAVNGLPHSFVRYLARKARMNPETEFTITPLQPQALVAAMKTGTIDAMAYPPPFSLAAVNDGGVLWVSGPETNLPELNPFPYNVVLVRPDYCQAAAATCRGFVAALKQAIMLMQNDPSASMAALSKTFDKMDPATLKQSYEIFTRYTRVDLALTEEMYANVVAFDRISGFIPETAVVPPITELYIPQSAR